MACHLIYRGKPTKALEALRACAKAPYGVTYPYCVPHFTYKGNLARSVPFLKLVSAGLVEHSKGPRGGLRLTATEKGRAALLIVKTYPPGKEMDAAFKLVGL